MRKQPPLRVTSVRPGHPEQPKLVVDGSPLALIGIFLVVLRERFSTGNGPEEFVWNNDPNQASLIIESGFEDPDIRDKKPAIFVDKDESVYAKLVIGDRAGHRFTDAKDWQWCLSTVPIVVDCVASKKGESAIIGDITQWSLYAASDAIQAIFGFHDFTTPRLGRTVPWEADREAWTTPVSFQVQYNVMWSTVPIAPLLQDIALRISQAGTTPSEYFFEVVTRKREAP